jgi:hypothetical protein
LEAKLEEDLSTVPKGKGSIDVHIVESEAGHSTEATTGKKEGEPVCTISMMYPKIIELYMVYSQTLWPLVRKRTIPTESRYFSFK